MRRIMTGVLALTMMTGSVAILQAGAPCQGDCHGRRNVKGRAKEVARKVWDYTCREYSRIKHWPKPFIYPDRAAARAPFYVMVAKGWKMQTTLSEHHFRDGTAELTPTGRAKVRWILTSAPSNWRSIYFVTGDDPQIADGRRIAVEQSASRFMVQGESVPIEPTHNNVEGWPGDYTNHTIVKYKESMPDPRLPAPADDGGGF